MHPPTTETMYIGDKELKNTRENAVKQQRQVEGCHVPCSCQCSCSEGTRGFMLIGAQRAAPLVPSEQEYKTRV